jgi:hypothetical protein
MIKSPKIGDIPGCRDVMVILAPANRRGRRGPSGDVQNSKGHIHRPTPMVANQLTLGIGRKEAVLVVVQKPCGVVLRAGARRGANRRIRQMTSWQAFLIALAIGAVWMLFLVVITGASKGR